MHLHPKQTRRAPVKSWIALVALLAGATSMLAGEKPAEAQAIFPPGVFRPASPGIIDITKAPYNAAKDGSVDVTATIQQAIRDLLSDRSLPLLRKTIYFPRGTYLVSDTLDWMGVTNGTATPYARLSFQGEGRDNTVIRLKDSATGFTSTTTPKPVIKTESINGTSNDAYDNSFFDLTIDVGSGNAGAVGISYAASNQASIRNVLIRASGANPVGYTGIQMIRAYPGPCYLKGVTINGFWYGIEVGHLDYGIVLENITLNNQVKAGIWNKSNVLSIRHLTSTNSVTAVDNNDSSTAFVVLLDSTLGGGSGTANAIENAGGLLVRNTTTSGYALAINNTAGTGADAPNGTVTEFVSHSILHNADLPSPDHTLNLPISETPTYSGTDFNYWVNVTDYGVVPNIDTDQTTQIQAAINAAVTANKPTVYFPTGQYVISGQLTISGGIRRLLGFGAVIRPKAGVYADVDNPKPAIIVNTSSSLIIDNFMIQSWFAGTPGAGAILHQGAQPLILTNLTFNTLTGYQNAPGSGDLYVENCVGPAWNFSNPGQKIWARQINPENTGTKIINNGCTLWILGLKTEELGTAIQTTGGGQTEVLGGFLYPLHTYAGAPAFTSTDSKISLSYVTEAYTAATNDYTDQVRETRGSTARTLLRSQVPRRGLGSMVPLFTGFPDNSPVDIILDNQDNGVALTGVWSSSTSATGYYGTDYLTNLAVGAGTKSVRFTPDLPSAGTYQVFARWTSGANRAPSVPIAITSQSGTTTVNVNEQINGGQWVLLGSYPFAAGTAGSVTVRTDGTSGGYYVIADAVRFVK